MPSVIESCVIVSCPSSLRFVSYLLAPPPPPYHSIPSLDGIPPPAQPPIHLFPSPPVLALLFLDLRCVCF